MNILVDAMGGDNAPNDIILGCIEAVKQAEGFEVTLLGDEEQINKYVKEKKLSLDRIKISHCDEVVTNDDKPTRVVRTKKNSSMVVGLKMIKEKKGDVFISAGNTGALLAGSLLILGRIDGVDRPALTAFIPTKKGPLLLLDVGSNTMSRPINYIQFALMGSMYIHDILGIEKPKVGLINIGEEKTKGTDIVKQAYTLLEKANIDFVGNIEGRFILDGNIDIAVCDGFVGNVMLKVIEGAADFFMGEIKEIYKSPMAKMSAVAVKGGFKNLKKKLNYEEYGGVPLLGVNGKVCKCHGSSSNVSIRNTIINAVNYANSSIIERIGEEFKYLEVEDIG